jgi:hypothetical protein
MFRKIRLLTTGSSIILFLIALTQDCYCASDNCQGSFMALLFGVAGVFLGGAALTWLANPLLVIAWFTAKNKPQISLVCSFSAVLISLSFLLFKSVIINEAGTYGKIMNYQAGYWLWLASSVVLCLGQISLRLESNVTKT